jgi:hypothetical protein
MRVTAHASAYRQVGTLSGLGVTSPDGDGGYTPVAASLSPSTWRFAIEKASLRAAERHFAAAVIARSTHMLTGRYHAGITTGTQIVWVDRAGATHTANVTDADDVEGAGVTSVVLVSEVVN